MILVCGEALVDLFVHDAGSDSITTQAVLGGSPFNVAIALARLGQPAGFYGGISQDRFGGLLVEKLKSHGIDLSHVVRPNRLSTISVIATDEGGSPSYSFHGDGKADRLVELRDLPPELPKDVEALTFGSYTITVPPVCDTFLALVKREAGRRMISIDPNVRPTVTPDMAEWRQRFEAFLPYANMVKASDEDLVTAYGDAVDIDGLAKSWHAIGPSLVLITHGSRGATGYLRGQAPMFAPGRSVEVIDTVGAGDTFHAAILAELARTDRLRLDRFHALPVAELKAAIDYAIAASSVTCTRAGADVPTQDDVEQVLGRSVTELGLGDPRP